MFQLLGLTQQLSQSVGTAAKRAFDEGDWDRRGRSARGRG
jgi:hypothetical protein